ncbi:UDP-glucose 4-epimerase GalE [Methyloceanibacter sp.]|uniref:UDP-glucose 4-epimerase GalE n=1 Tax=Methyloceanibacter sp. TaxID=1965321 RepID=UPI003D6D2D4A
MSVLVTGGAGYIGSHAVLELLDAGEEVIVLDNLSTGFRSAVPAAAQLVVGDVGDQGLVRQILSEAGVDAILHFAGSIIVPESVSDPLGYYLNNTCKSRNLIACAVEAGLKHFIFSSTAAVYGIGGDDPIDEDAPIDPISPYGSSKLMTETMLRDAAKAHDFTYLALRYFNVAGADPRGRAGQSTRAATHLIKVAAQAALGERPWVEVFGDDYPTPDGTGVRDYIHVTDLARAHLAALRYLRAGGESTVLNCGYGRGFSVLEVISSVRRAAKWDVPVRRAARRRGDPATLVATADRVRTILGWRPELDDLDTIVAHALLWERHLQSTR